MSNDVEAGDALKGRQPCGYTRLTRKGTLTHEAKLCVSGTKYGSTLQPGPLLVCANVGHDFVAVKVENRERLLAIVLRGSGKNI